MDVPDFDMLSMSVGFLVGAAVGAAGGYYASLFTDRRREQERRRKRLGQFRSVAKDTCADMIREIRMNLQSAPTIRELVVMAPSRPSPPKLIGVPLLLKADTENDYVNKALVLERMGFLELVPPAGTSHYFITEEFVALVQEETP